MAFPLSVQSVVLFIILAICMDTTFSDKNDVYRLPNDTAPEHYYIQITTKLEKDDFKFSGICTIGLKVLVETKMIVLHSKLADIQRTELMSSDGYNITIKDYDVNHRNNFLTISFNHNLTKGELFYLKIWYSSKLRTDKLGFYKSSYTDHLGSKVWLAVTQFAPTEARHAFPCYDEPNRKATFQIEITHPSELRAISSTESLGIKPNMDGTSTTKFQKTEQMSTYLVGFVISDFEKIITRTHVPEVLHEVYIRPNKVSTAQYSMNFASKLLDVLADCFEENFPQTVMRNVALPDFYFNGMENWGIVMYKENKFLYDPTKHSVDYQVAAISLIGHEIAHSWFGNLVTMEWWTYVWLKEGFSTLYAYYGAEMAWPTENYLELFLIQKMHTVLIIDGSTKTRPMTHYVEEQMEIMKNYDKIAYNKAASVLRMWEHAFGHSTFEKAVNIYLTRNKFQNADEEDLIDSFAAAMPTYPRNYVEQIIKSWTAKKGFPVVTAIRNYESPAITLTQERFLNNGDVEKASLWRIPINFKKSGATDNFDSTTPDIWMIERTLTLEETTSNGKNITLDSTEWIIFNKQQTGFYRVNYDEKNWELITQALKDDHENIHVLNRAQLIDDSFALAAAGRLNFSVPLKLIGYMTKERYYAPWAALSAHFMDFKRHLDKSTLESFNKYILNMALGYVVEKDKADKIKGVGEGLLLEQLTRNIVNKLICEIDYNRCSQGTLLSTDPNTRYMSYCFLMHKDDENVYLKIRKVLREEEDLNVRQDIVSSLGCSKNSKLLKFFLLSTIENPSDLKLWNEEVKIILQSIYQKSYLGLELAMEFISREQNSIYKLNPELLNIIIPNIAKYVHTLPSKEIFDTILHKVGYKIQTDTVFTAQSEVISNLRWKMLYNDDVNRFLSSSNALHYVSMWTFISLCTLAFLR